MATTKRLKSPPKTNAGVGKLVKYVLNPEKTTDEKCLYADSINCSLITAVDEFKSVRNRWDKQSGNYAYHFEQSFKPGETTPEEALQCGKELAAALFGDEGYQVIFATHLDREHLHNHFVVNAVNMRTGLKLQTDHNFIRRMRSENDRICKQHNLSVISEPSNNGKSYAEWLIERNGGFTWRGEIRKDIDKLIPTVATFKELLQSLEKQGYTIWRRGKTLSVSPPGTNTHFRFNKLGKGYTEEDISNKILYSFKRNIVHTAPVRKNYVKLKGNFPLHSKSRFRGMYYTYVYRLRNLTYSPSRQSRMPLQARSDAKKLREFAEDLQLLSDYKIDNIVQLAELFNKISERKHTLCSRRITLRSALADCDSPADAKSTQNEIFEINEEIKKLNKQLQSCQRIYERSERIKATNIQVAKIEKQIFDEKLKKNMPSDNRDGVKHRKE